MKLLVLAAVLAACDGGGGRGRSRDAAPGPCDGPGVRCVVKEASLPAMRGAIRDRHGVPLATGDRVYPRGALAAHVVGYVSPLTAEEAAKVVDATTDDRIGRWGIESTWENYLRGKRGLAPYVVDAHGARVEGEAAARFLSVAPVDPVAGNDVVLTLDADLQQRTEDALARFPAAAAVVVELATGRIRAMASLPAFDPVVMAGHPTAAQLAALEDDPRRPFVDKTTGVGYPPGELYRFVTTIAALEDGVAPDDPDAPLKVGVDRLAAVATAFGFGAATGLALHAERAGRVPDHAWYAQRGAFRPAYATAAADATHDVEVTVLQLAVAYAALASGTRYTPQLVERIETSAGQVVVTYEPRVAATPSAPEVLDVVRRRLAAGVTAELDDRAWYAGWTPELAIVVMVEHAGAMDAAAAAKSIAAAWH